MFWVNKFDIKMKIKDTIWIGIICGILAPSIGILIFVLTNYSEQTLHQFVNTTIEGKILSPLLSLYAVINLGLFYLFLHFDRLYSARGVIFSTILYGVLIVILKFVL